MSTTTLLVQSMPVLAQGAVLTVKFAVLSMIFGLIAAVWWRSREVKAKLAALEAQGIRRRSA